MRALALGGVILGVVVLCALVPQLIAPYDPLFFDYNALMAPPSWEHPFGTDQFGRDVLSRTVWAARVDLQIAVLAVAGPMLVGGFLGLMAGYLGGIAEAILGRAMDLVVTFPFLVLVIAIVAVLGPGLTNMYIAIAIAGWVPYARLMRGEVAVVAATDHISAARGLGYGTARILARHVLPNAVRPVLAYAVSDMALAILLGSSLGYLGLGAQPPEAEWGVLVADGKNFLTQAPWIALFPGVAVVICGLGFSLLGDGLADRMDIRR
ncbi:ABC transporter permease [Roseomonas gilardii]|uniref:ABC transporter permease n=1 Tax=Roseomonas gilardii TaxID=257708 RepID=UPI00119FF032|nr:ABC transporter permease [Roseomonas gilardii]